MKFSSCSSILGGTISLFIKILVYNLVIREQAFMFTHNRIAKKECSMNFLILSLLACGSASKEETPNKKVLEIENSASHGTNTFPTIAPYYYQAKRPKSGATEDQLDNCPSFDRMRVSLDNSQNKWALIQVVVGSYPSLPTAFQKCNTEALMFDYPDSPGYSKKQNEATCSNEQKLRFALKKNSKSIGVQEVKEGKGDYVFKLSSIEHQIIFIDHKGNAVHREADIGCGD